MTQVAVIHTAFEDTPNTVAFVDVGDRTGDEALEYAYRWTNHVMGSWSIKEKFLGDHENGDYNDDVHTIAPLHWSEKRQTFMGLRSTSVGDQMVMNGKKYVVSGFGFKELV